jgi:hypothetical protein
MNYYALAPDSSGRVTIFTPTFSWDSIDDARQQINVEKKKKGEKPYKGKILHVVLDMSSGRLYLPGNDVKTQVNSDPEFLAMYQAICLKIEKQIDYIPLASPINGDPLDTIRIRKIKDFYSAADFIKRQVKNKAEFEKDISLTVIEANLAAMPITRKSIFGDSTNVNQSKFIGENRVVEFWVKDKVDGRERDLVIHQERAPFILINMDPNAKVSDADKERLIVSAYREYAEKNRPDSPISRESPRLQSFKYLMYIGWSFKELCLYVLSEKNIQDLNSFLFNGSFIYNAAKSLKEDGYPDPTVTQYYYSFKIDKDFPIAFQPDSNVEIFNYSSHPDILKIVFFDVSKSFVTLKTPLFMQAATVKKVFNSKSSVIVSQYDTTEKLIKTNTDLQQMESMSQGSVTAIVKDVSNITQKPVDQIEIRATNNHEKIFERKHVSDYPQATEIIKNLCRKLEKKPESIANAFPQEIRFDDLEVIVGPWKEISGFLGGYIDARRMKQIPGEKKVTEPIPGFKVYPPAILIDNSSYPSVGDRINVIIHEYRHHINTQLWIESPEYDALGKPNESETERIKRMVKYLQSPDERMAHKVQFKYMLVLGMSSEQILRKLMNGKPTIKNIPIAKEYLGIIKEAEIELQSEKEEEITSQKLEEDVSDYTKKMEAQSEFFDPNDPFDISMS